VPTTVPTPIRYEPKENGMLGPPLSAKGTRVSRRKFLQIVCATRLADLDDFPNATGGQRRYRQSNRLWHISCWDEIKVTPYLAERLFVSQVLLLHHVKVRRLLSCDPGLFS
jgi:hypothetical protein